MSRPGWYMLCYDIADPKRLGKIHRVMKKNGIAAQKSVFFVQGTEGEIKAFVNRISGIMNPSEDDLRAYPVVGPKQVWTTGGILETFPLIRPGAKSKNSQRPSIRPKKNAPSIWRQILSKLFK